MATTFVFPTFVADGSLITGDIRLPTYVADGSLTVGDFHLPVYATTPRTDFFLPPYNAGLIYFVHTPTGGVIVGGAAFVVGDPYIPTGGVVVGGTAPAYFWLASTSGVIVGGTAPLTVLPGGGTIVATAPDADAVITAAYLPNGAIVASYVVGSSTFTAGFGGAGTITANAPRPLAALVGGFQNVKATYSMASAVLTGFGGAAATISATAKRASGVLTGTVTGYGAIVAQARNSRAVLAAVSGNTGSITGSAPKSKGVLTAYVTISGTITATTPMATADLSGGTGIVATLLFDVPMARAYLTNTAALNTLVKELVINSITNAVTEYTNYGFDSFAVIGGVTYAAGSDGIYELDTGSTDQTASINAYFETGAISFSSEYLKRMESLYAAYRTTGDIRVSVRTDEGIQYAYTMKYDGHPTLRQRRVPIGKGLKGKYWQYKIENVDGAAFGFDTFNILAHETVRRIGV